MLLGHRSLFGLYCLFHLSVSPPCGRPAAVRAPSGRGAVDIQGDRHSNGMSHPSVPGSRRHDRSIHTSPTQCCVSPPPPKTTDEAAVATNCFVVSDCPPQPSEPVEEGTHH